MKSAFPPLNRRGITFAAFGVLAGLLVASGPLCAQSPGEHASHHPAAGAGAMPAAGGAPGAGGMGDMGEMMKSMGQPPPKELYPSLMALPELTPEKRRQVEQQAGERMHAGSMLMGQALDTLNAGAQSGDYPGMHEAMTRLREGVAQLESGIAARRALADGRAPREVALAWFKQEMRLPAPVVGEATQGGFGSSLFHLFTMALLVIFAAAMLAMYFLKMRRAAALFGRIEPDRGSPPPGSAPELAGGKPPAGDKPPSADKPAAAADKPAAAAPPKTP